MSGTLTDRENLFKAIDGLMVDQDRYTMDEQVRRLLVSCYSSLDDPNPERARSTLAYRILKAVIEGDLVSSGLMEMRKKPRRKELPPTALKGGG
jgi:hypothetical protein